MAKVLVLLMAALKFPLTNLSSPSQEYGERLRNRELRVARFTAKHRRTGNFRLLLFIVAAVLAWLSFQSHLISVWWLAAPLGAFIAASTYHTKILRALASAERAVLFYKHGMARLEDRWSGMGETGERFNNPHHVYAVDLDLFGKDSLFQLLSGARTRMGEEKLADWLLTPSSLEEIHNRQAAITELRQLLDFREDMAVAGEHARVGVQPVELMEWAESPAQLDSRWLGIVAPALAVAAIATFLIWGIWNRMLPFLVTIAIEAVIFYSLRKKLEELLHKAERAFEDLDLLSALLERVCSEQFQAPLLSSLSKKLGSDSISASRAVERLRSITGLVIDRRNMFLRMFDVPLMFSVQVALAAEGWRRQHGGNVRRWIAALGEMEALLSLATYSFEHPADPFPEFVPEFVSGAACFESEEIGHPLLPASVCVRNDVKMCRKPRVLLLSGSNMSGKSTLLRAVGINAVLAMAGGPVHARNVRLTPLQVGASIRVTDSLREGKSRFYAEITRLRQIVDLTAGEFPVLFLLDEVLQGTNSNDRRVGTQGIVAGFLERGAIGMLSTHDLALTEIAGTTPGDVENVHFQDELKDGRINFDYILHPGIITKTNGLELMRSIGLEI